MLWRVLVRCIAVLNVSLFVIWGVVLRVGTLYALPSIEDLVQAVPVTPSLQFKLTFRSD